MNKNNLILLLFLMYCNCIFSQEISNNIKIKGIVIDDCGKYVQNSIITIYLNKIEVYKDTSNSTGNFEFENLISGNVYYLEALHPGRLNGKSIISTKNVTRDSVICDTIYHDCPGPPIGLPTFYLFLDTDTEYYNKYAIINNLLKDNPEVTLKLRICYNVYDNLTEFSTKTEEFAINLRNSLISNGIDEERILIDSIRFTPEVISSKLANKFGQPFSEGVLLNDYFLNTLNENNKQIAMNLNRRIEFRVLNNTYKKKK